MDAVEVKVGQIWEDYDIRSRGAGGGGRRLKVLEIVEGKDGIVKAVVQHPSGLGGKTKIRVDRFKPNSTGYRLIS